MITAFFRDPVSLKHMHSEMTEGPLQELPSAQETDPFHNITSKMWSIFSPLAVSVLPCQPTSTFSHECQCEISYHSLSSIQALPRKEPITTVHGPTCTPKQRIWAWVKQHIVYTPTCFTSHIQRKTEKQAGHCKGVNSMTTVTWSCIVEPSMYVVAATASCNTPINTPAT